MAEDGMGWIESVDPTTGRTFYANKYTRTTQWDPPPGWKGGGANGGASSSSGGRHGDARRHGNGGHRSGGGNNFPPSDIARDRRGGTSRASSSSGGGLPPLPEGWEEMTDPSTGRKFYVDHATKVTTWERPSAAAAVGGVTGGGSGIGGDMDGFGFSPDSIMGLNRHGSHSQWENPHAGSGSSRGRPRRSNSNSSYNSYGASSLLMRGDDSHGPPPALDFVVVSVPDAMRMDCPGCGSGFTYTKRRHHCRLCGDVFCDACSSSRTVLPLDGPEFDTPVRVCDVCMKDVKKGNYFSLRRYLTPLELFDPDDRSSLKKVQDGAGSGDKTREITSGTVAASLSSLSADVDAMVHEPMSFKEKMTISAPVLVTAVGKHLSLRETAEYAIRVLASLLTVANVVGDESWALAIYEGDAAIGERGVKDSDSNNSLAEEEEKKGKGGTRPCEIVNDVLTILEWNGSDSRSLGALEQAIKVIYYITDPAFIASAISKREADGGAGPVDVDAAGEAMHNFLRIDIHRAFRSMLDHATSSTSLSLQRWATATLRHLITEDQRRATTSINSFTGGYESFMTQLVSTGGIMILCSLLASEDAETRTHATSTLESIVIATREIGMATSSSSRFTSREGRGTKADASIVSAIASNGGCGAALAHLLISSEESVAEMGCSFASSLISPLLTDPRGSGKALQHCYIAARGNKTIRGDSDDGLYAYRSAALALVVGEGGDASCLPSLIQIIRSGTDSWGASKRSMKLQVVAGECLAAIALAIEHILGDGKESDSLYLRATNALQIMEQECIYDVAFQIVTSDSSRSLDPTRDSPQARLKEAAGLTLLALASCSEVAASYLTSPETKAISQLLTIASELIDAPSALRGEWASRGLCYLECCAMLLLRAWNNNDDEAASACLLDALDANVIGLASRQVTQRVHLKHHDKSYSQMRIKIAICYMLGAMFGIAIRGEKDQGNDSNSMYSGSGNATAAARLYSAIDADCAAALAYGDGSDANSRKDLVASTIFLLSATLPYAHRFANEEKDEPLPMMDLSEASLLAVGSMCGAMPMSDKGHDKIGNLPKGKYSHLRSDAAQMACKALTSTVKDTPTGASMALLPSVLIGALGESLILPALQLTLAVAQNSDNGNDVRGELARCGMLVPVGDILQQALSSGERYTFSVTLGIVRFCGPSLYGNGSNSRGSLASVQNCIKTLSTILMTPPENNGGGINGHQRQTLYSLKHESLLAMEALGTNQALHSTLIDVFPSLTDFLMQLTASSAEHDASDIICSALRTIRSIISLPSTSPSSLAAKKGLITSLVEILNDDQSDNSRTREMSLELLHAIAVGDGSKAPENGSNLLYSGVLGSVLSLIANEGGQSEKTTLLGVDIIHFVVSGIDSTNPTLTAGFIDIIASQERFLRALIATMVATNKDVGDEERISSMLYGKPLWTPNDTTDLFIAKANITLFKTSSLMCADGNCVGKERFLHAFMLKDVHGATAESVSLAACIFLEILMDERNGMCVPQDSPAERSYFLNVQLPNMRSQLMEILSMSLDECLTGGDSSFAQELIQRFQIPRLCLQLCQSSGKVFEAAFGLYENVVQPLPVDMLGTLLADDKSSLVALFDLVTGRNNVDSSEHSKEIFALTLGHLAKSGHLYSSVERFGLRNNAIAALSAAIQGSEDGRIDDNEDSLPRICVESLAALLCRNQNDDKLEITTLEARTMATAIGKILSSTVLSRFFTQASLETTFDPSIDHSADRTKISQSPEARLLCALAAFPETLEMLNAVGALEAIGLIANEGELGAILAIEKATETSPTSVVKVDAHLSIMDAFIQVESKLAGVVPSDTAKLRQIAAKCISIIVALSKDNASKPAILNAEQSHECLKTCARIVSASSKMLIKPPTASRQSQSQNTITVEIEEKKEEPSKKVEEQPGENLQLGDSVTVQSGHHSSPSRGSDSDGALEGVVAHLGTVEFAPGDDWIGIRLTGSSVGLGRNDGTVKGVHYFDAGEISKNGVFAKRNNVKKQVPKAEPPPEPLPVVKEVKESAQEEEIVPKEEAQEEPWNHLLSNDDNTLQAGSFALLLTLSSSKSHRDLLLGTESLMKDIMSVILVDSTAIVSFQLNAINLLASLALYLDKSDSKLTELFCSVVESRTKLLQISRDKRILSSTKELLAVAMSGLEMCSFMNAEEHAKSLKIASDLFTFLADSLYKGPRGQRLAASAKDGALFQELLSFFVLALGSESLRASIMTTKFVSSLIRFIMMTSGASLDCQIPTAKSEGEECWNAALTNCLFYLSQNLIQSLQDDLGISYASLIAQTEPRPNSFDICLKYIAGKNGGASSLLAKQILSRVERLADS